MSKINLKVCGQNLVVRADAIVSGTIRHIDLEYTNGTPEEWDGLEVWAHFAKGEEVYDVLMVDGHMPEGYGLNLTEGLWTIYMHGDEQIDGQIYHRATTNSVKFYVEPFQNETDLFPGVQPSAAEQIVMQARTYRDEAEAAKDSAEESAENAEASAIRAEQAKQSTENLLPELVNTAELAEQAVIDKAQEAVRKIDQAETELAEVVQTAVNEVKQTGSAQKSAVEEEGSKQIGLVAQANASMDAKKEEALSAIQTAQESAGNAIDQKKDAALQELDPYEGIREEVDVLNGDVSVLNGKIDKKTEKHLLGFDGTHITEDGQALTFAQVHTMLMDTPDFVVCVYNDRAYHPNVVKSSQIVFISSFVSSGYERMDRISLLPSGIATVTFGESESVANKTNAITDANKESESKYPSNKAVFEYAAPKTEVGTLKEDLTALGSRIDNIDTVIIETVEPLQKQADNTDRKLDALWKLNKGQTYDIEQTVEEGHNTSPSGSTYMTVEDVRGKTEQDNYHMGLAENATTIEGCAESEIRELVMEGKTEQDSTNGYNLVKPRTKTSDNLNGIVFNMDEDGWVSAKGTATNRAFFYIGDVEPLPSGTYTISAEFVGTKSSINTRVQITNAESLPFFQAANTGFNTMNVGVEFIPTGFALRIESGDVVDFKVRAMFEKGAVAHPYEPFTGGLPSPNPEYPQDIHSVEEINVKVTGKNLIGDLYRGTIDASTGEFNAYNYNAVLRHVATDYIPVKYLSSYTMKMLKGFDNNKNRYYDKEKKYLGSNVLSGGNFVLNVDGATTTVAIDREDVAYIRFEFDKVNDEVWDSLKNNFCQFERSSAATDFEPYTEQTLSIIPPKPLNKIGSYADVCDVENGVWRYVNKQKTIREIGAFNQYSADKKYVFQEELADAVFIANSVKANMLSDTFICLDWNKASFNNIWIALYKYDVMSNAHIAVCTSPNETFNTASQFVAKYGDAKILYASTNPTTEPINPTDLEKLRALATYSGTTNIFITDQNGNDISNQFRFKRAEGSAENDVVAPTPMYPSEIVSVDEITVKHCGKNLLKLSNDFNYTGNGVGTESNFTNGNAFVYSAVIDIRNNKRFAFSGNLDGVNSGAIRCCLCKEYPKVGGTYTRGSNLSLQHLFTNDYNYVVLIFVLANGVNKYDESWNWMLESGTVSTEYEPYREEVRTIIPPRSLNKLGDVFDKADIENGVWEYRTRNVDFDYSLLKAYGTDSNGSYIEYPLMGQPPIYDENNTVICLSDKWVGVAYNERHADKNKNTCRIYKNAGATSFWFQTNANGQVYTIAEMKELVDESDVVYVTANIENINIDAEDLDFLRTLDTIPSTDNIFITDQNGNDVPWLAEYIINLREVQ